MEALVEAGVDLNVKDDAGRPLLFSVAEQGYRCAARNVRYLVQHGADPYVKNSEGLSFVEWVRERNDTPILFALGIPTPVDDATFESRVDALFDARQAEFDAKSSATFHRQDLEMEILLPISTNLLILAGCMWSYWKRRTWEGHLVFAGLSLATAIALLFSVDLVERIVFRTEGLPKSGESGLAIVLLPFLNLLVLVAGNAVIGGAFWLFRLASLRRTNAGS